jgi:hypothetical protein
VVFQGNFAVKLLTCVPSPFGTYAVTVLKVQPAVAMSRPSCFGSPDLPPPSASTRTTMIRPTKPAAASP